MITYELAKRLKDAGFPLSRPWWNNNGVADEKDIERLFCLDLPTLSELIESIGITTFEYLLYNGHWKAKGCSVNEVTGETPDEAVANLWLALHKHNSENYLTDTFTMPDGVVFTWQKRKDLGLEKYSFNDFCKIYYSFKQILNK
jgi:hypothetical protein